MRASCISASSLPALLLVVIPALLMVSTVRFRSFKTIDSAGSAPVPGADLLRRPAHGHRHAPAERARRDFLQLPGVAVHRDDCHSLKPEAGPAGGAPRRVIVTRRPACPSRSSTAIVPPFSSTLRFAIVSPSPVPVAFVENRARTGARARRRPCRRPCRHRRSDGAVHTPCADRQRPASAHRVQRVLDDVHARAQQRPRST